MTTLGSHIRELRTDRELTIRDVARAADIAENTVGRIERDEHEPNVSVLRRIAIALDVPAAELLTYDEVDA